MILLIQWPDNQSVKGLFNLIIYATVLY